MAGRRGGFIKKKLVSLGIRSLSASPHISDDVEAAAGAENPNTIPLGSVIIKSAIEPNFIPNTSREFFHLPHYRREPLTDRQQTR